MRVRIALFRGINVGGRSVLPMKDVVAILGDLGARSVKTYIQSGNAAFVSGERDTSRLSAEIRREVKKRRGFEPHVLLLEFEDLERMIRRNPFPEAVAEPGALHAGFLASPPARPNLKALEALKTASERFRLVDRVFYLHAPEGTGRSKLAASVERLLGVPMTDRNWRTVGKILEMARSLIEPPVQDRERK